MSDDAAGRDAMNPDVLHLARGAGEDIAFVMATERRPGYEEVVGRWTEAEHRAALADGRHVYFIARLGSQPVGFAIVRDWPSPEEVVHIKRVAVSCPGLGHGKALVAGLVDLIFRSTGAHRIWLGLVPDNHRARRAYEAVGFKAEGLAPGAALVAGGRRDELVMAMVRPDWLAAQRREG